MMGYTHVAIGMAAGLALGISIKAQPADLALLAAISGVFALLPDVDHPKSAVRRRLGILGHVGLFWLSHRGITHTLLAVLIVALGAFYLLPHRLALASIFGYGSHLVGDMVTRSGLAIFWPVYRESVHLLPRPLRITTGGKIEGVIFLLVLAAMGFSVYTFIYPTL